MRLVLASTSAYRRELLARLRLPFEQVAPGVEEHALPGEQPATQALRLAETKARAVAMRFPAATVIGCDQLAELDGAPLGKPGGRSAAIDQLLACAGRTVRFHTAVHVVAAEGAGEQAHLDQTEVVFRDLLLAEVERYVDTEQPFDCAGSFKCEGLGIALFERIHSQDPTALIGLPLIATASLLRRAGLVVP